MCIKTQIAEQAPNPPRVGYNHLPNRFECTNLSTFCNFRFLEILGNFRSIKDEISWFKKSERQKCITAKIVIYFLFQVLINWICFIIVYTATVPQDKEFVLSCPSDSRLAANVEYYNVTDQGKFYKSSTNDISSACKDSRFCSFTVSSEVPGRHASLVLKYTCQPGKNILQQDCTLWFCMQELTPFNFFFLLCIL